MKNKQMSVNSKQMNILLWVIQILLALYNLGGGIYMILRVTNAFLDSSGSPSGSIFSRFSLTRNNTDVAKGTIHLRS
jgi:hypothetical protein